MKIMLPETIAAPWCAAYGGCAPVPAAAAALPRCEHACGLGTGGLFVTDVADLTPVDGYLPVGDVVPDPPLLEVADRSGSKRRDTLGRKPSQVDLGHGPDDSTAIARSHWASRSSTSRQRDGRPG